MTLTAQANCSSNLEGFWKIFTSMQFPNFILNSFQLFHLPAVRVKLFKNYSCISFQTNFIFLPRAIIIWFQNLISNYETIYLRSHYLNDCCKVFLLVLRDQKVSKLRLFWVRHVVFALNNLADLLLKGDQLAEMLNYVNRNLIEF